jgi:putative sigma-54 modulation protein
MMTIQTEAVHFTADAKLLQYIESKLRKLEKFFDKILNVNVLLKLENNHARVHEKVLEIKIQVPGTVLFIKESHLTFEAAVDRAVLSLRRSLQKIKERSR